jgi:hypothetical protein
MQGRVHAGDAAHHRLDVTFGTSRRGRHPGSDVLQREADLVGGHQEEAGRWLVVRTWAVEAGNQ